MCSCELSPAEVGKACKPVYICCTAAAEVASTGTGRLAQAAFMQDRGQNVCSLQSRGGYAAHVIYCAPMPESLVICH